VIAALLFAMAFSNTSQLVVVTTADWTATAGVMQRYEKHLYRWRAVGPSIDVVIGRTGFAWGRGFHGPQNGPQKKEGDGKAPAGIFAIGTSFGFSPAADFKLPYLPLHDTTECVDDINSTFYNQIVERTREADWKSSEKMHAIPQYKWGAVILHNALPQKGEGSCVFLHIWSRPESTTAGCTAMSEEDLLTLLQWLDPKKAPRLVQMPRPEYERLRKEWALP
jgi:D-alanyl-D-alanine dipeptidase